MESTTPQEANSQNTAVVPGGAGQEPKKEKKRGRGRFALGLLVGVLCGGLVFGALVPTLLGTTGLSLSSEDSAVNSSSVTKLKQLESLIQKYYYEPDTVEVSTEEDGLYKGLLESLGDPYSEYYTADEMQQLSSSLQGVFGGIGAWISTDKTTGYPKIAGIIDDTPAQKAGLREDDIIYKVDGEDCGSMSTDEVVSKVRGEVGTDVTLTIARSGEPDYLEITITRDTISEQMVSSKVTDEDSRIGYLALAEFTEVATDQFKDALSDLYDQGIQALILDLRGNPGGEVDVVTSIANEIIPEGLVFYMEDRDGNKKEYTADGKDEMQIPLVVLVNGNSASASEILSGAIQDSGKGIILGEQTYGKGVVQTVYNLTDGSAVKLTVAHYFTRNGNDINKVGITPDVKVDFDSSAYYKDGTDNQYQKAVELLQEELDGASMEEVIKENSSSDDTNTTEASTESAVEDATESATEETTASQEEN
ncbi:MAG: S41 family peptidase [Lachnospiraceae bacterium]